MFTTLAATAFVVVAFAVAALLVVNEWSHLTSQLPM
jgi:hypothetical protein